MTFQLANSNLRDRPQVGIVHLGIGAFCRGHILTYLEDAMAASGGAWGMAGVSFRSPAIRDRLAAQDNLYVALERARDEDRPRVIGALRRILYLAEEKSQVLSLLSAPSTRLVTLTVTEKGYCHAPASGQLDLSHPDIRHDIEMPHDPVSVPGVLLAGLARRRALGHRPFTIMSCDNLPANGKLLQGVVLELARNIDPALADWVAREGAFPSSMVDRIVPATTEEDIAHVAATTDYHDAAPIIHEPFRQWVIEDWFVDDEQPDLAAAGAQLVNDVTPFELMKLRCLNGSHSTLAYFGKLAGLETVSQAIGFAPLARFVDGLWHQEIMPSLSPLPETDLAAYTATLKQRFQNTAIVHKTQQIAMDGSQKLPQRLLATAEDNLSAGRPVRHLAAAVAAWMRYVRGTNDAGQPHPVVDPMADRFSALAATADGKTYVQAMLTMDAVFPAPLAQNQNFAGQVAEAYEAIALRGSRRFLEEFS